MKPYLSVWLRRTRKQLSASGKLSELALILSREGGGTEEEWRAVLQGLLVDGGQEPDLDLLTRLDSLLAKPANSAGGTDPEADLFD